MKNKLIINISSITIDLNELFKDEEEFKMFKNSSIDSQKLFLAGNYTMSYIHEDVLDRIDEAIIEEIENE